MTLDYTDSLGSNSFVNKAVFKPSMYDTAQVIHSKA